MILGGNSDAALRRVAEWGDGWYGFNLADVEEAAGCASLLRSLCRTNRRDPQDLRLAVALRDPAPTDLARLADVGIDELVLVASSPDDPIRAEAWVGDLARQWLLTDDVVEVLDDACPTSASPSNTMSSGSASNIGRPPHNRVNCTASRRITVVGSAPAKSSTSAARPSTATRIVRASGPVSSMATRDPSGALPSFPTTKAMLAATSSSAVRAAGLSRSASDGGRSSA